MNVFPSRYMPCPDCGASLERREKSHDCEPERRLDFVLFQLRDDVAGFEGELAVYLATPRGRFEAFYAERERTHPAGE